jgi:hypothetical protein
LILLQAQANFCSPSPTSKIRGPGCKMGVFCNCFGRRPLRVDKHSKPGYARIVEAKDPPLRCSLPTEAAAISFRHRISETVRADDDAQFLSMRLISVDEKQSFEASVESLASSSQSSTISLPSTRVTGLTVLTDNTGASRESRRSHESGTTLGAPPSYSSRRFASHPQSNRSSWDQRHPVLAEDWFDQFRES